MKPQELRIGDYVRFKHTGDIVKVYAIRQRGLEIEFKGEIMNFPIPCEYSDIEPIPIADICDRLPCIVHLEWADKAAHKGVYLYRGVLLTKLHELQNIHYALTGNEIEIEI